MSDFCIVKEGVILSCKEDGSGYLLKINDNAYEIAFTMDLQDIIHFRNALSDHIENEMDHDLNNFFE